MENENNTKGFWSKATKQSSIRGVDVKLISLGKAINNASNFKSTPFMLAKFMMFMCQLMPP